MVLEKDGEDVLDRSCEKWSATRSQGEEKYCTKIRRKVKWTDGILCKNGLLKQVTEGKTEGRIEVA